MSSLIITGVFLESESMDVRASGQPMRTIEIDRTLDVGDVIPGFTIPAKEIFAEA